MNQNLARFERLKRVLLVPEEFSAADGTMTHTFKSVDAESRSATTQIEDMYAKAELAGKLSH